MKTSQLSNLSRALLLLSAVCLVISIFVPIWQIDLDAPQYPEGLKLLIYSNALGGNVEIINGLNHYIGMKTLHADDFIEFTVLPYIIGFYALLCLLVALINRKKALYTLLALFVFFGIVAMADFWRWEYNYGHDLDPNAAIIVPGMAYQPPLIGFKQLLNFGAYSVPAIGGWLFILSGIFMLTSTLKEMNFFKRFSKTSKALPFLFVLFFISACSGPKTERIKINRDHCDFCKMTISNGQFAAEVKTSKGRFYKFDDIVCMTGYIKENTNVKFNSYYVNDFMQRNELINAENAFYLKSDEFVSPMGGNIAAFMSKEAAQSMIEKYHAVAISWKEINQ